MSTAKFMTWFWLSCAAIGFIVELVFGPESTDFIFVCTIIASIWSAADYIVKELS